MSEIYISNGKEAISIKLNRDSTAAMLNILKNDDYHISFRHEHDTKIIGIGTKLGNDNKEEA